MAYSQKISALARRFDRVLTFPFNTPCCAPSAASIRKIEEHFGFHLPAGLLQFAREAKFFNSWFASLGRDYTNPQHIIRINSYWRRRRRTRAIPRHLVIFNLGFDEDMDCFDLSHGNPATGEYEIQYWMPELNLCNSAQEAYADLPAYIEASVKGWEALRKQHSG